eukprot:5043546-Amphidinium_carterae.3
MARKDPNPHIRRNWRKGIWAKDPSKKATWFGIVAKTTRLTNLPAQSFCASRRTASKRHLDMRFLMGMNTYLTENAFSGS